MRHSWLRVCHLVYPCQSFFYTLFIWAIHVTLTLDSSSSFLVFFLFCFAIFLSFVFVFFIQVFRIDKLILKTLFIVSLFPFFSKKIIFLVFDPSFMTSYTDFTFLFQCCWLNNHIRFLILYTSIEYCFVLLYLMIYVSIFIYLHGVI